MDKKAENFITNLSVDELVEVIDALPFEKRDAIYKHLRSSYVEEDFRNQLEGAYYPKEITDNDFKEMTRLYVDEGKYDCNLSYWDNIDNIADEVMKKSFVYTVIANATEYINSKPDKFDAGGNDLEKIKSQSFKNYLFELMQFDDVDADSQKECAEFIWPLYRNWILYLNKSSETQ